MRKGIKKLLAVTLMMAMAYVFSTTAVYAKETDMEAILAEYHEKIENLENVSTFSLRNRNAGGINEIQAETVEALEQAGYTAYDVNPNTFNNVENALCTDLGEIGLNREGYYIVVVEDGNSNNASTYARSSTGSSFTYKYNGTTYILRYLTISAADDSGYAKSTYVDLLETTQSSLIEKALDTAISAYLSAVEAYTKVPLGTVASITGLSISDFKDGASATFGMYAGTNWTETYTQVWNDYDDKWAYGSCVEYAEVSSHFGGQYYDASTNRMEEVNDDESRKTVKSDMYSNYTWRKKYAVIGYLSSDIQYDVTGPVKYYYGNKVVVTHRKN